MALRHYCTATQPTCSGVYLLTWCLYRILRELEFELTIKLVPFELEHRSPIGVFQHLTLGLVPIFSPVGSLTNLSTLYQNRVLGYIEAKLTLLQYQKDEHLPQRFRETPSLPHPWHILTPSISVE